MPKSIQRDPVVEELVQRLERIAGFLESGTSDCERVSDLVGVMAAITNRSNPSFSPRTVGADLIDGVLEKMSGMHALKGMLERAYAGVDYRWQHWLTVGRNNSEPPVLDRKLFVPAESTEHRAAGKPFNMGLFTSTPAAFGRSMWELYLDPYVGSSLFPLPWNVWRIKVADDVRVFSVDSALSLVSLLDAFPLRHDGYIYPDWCRIAESYDALHMTFPGVVTTQGISLLTSHGPSSRSYWDVESTLWLNWCFDAAELLRRRSEA